jgi:signal peptide peptidase SppA
MKRIEEVMSRFGSRPALIRMASVSDYFGDSAPYRIEDGVAMIDVSGPLSNAKWSWGGTTYGDIQDQCKIAAADPTVKGVILCINSPGGETDNAFETAAVVAQLAQSKPVWAVASTMAYSAAYLLASQCDQIYCTSISGGVGSVGVYCAHMDYSQMLAKEGIKVTLISAGDGKTAGNPYEPLDDDDEADMQDEINRLYAEFVGAVATGRGMDSASIIKLGAKCYEGSAKAVSVGLADMPGDLATAWVDMCAAVNSGAQSPLMKARKGFAASAANKEKQMKETNAADVKTHTAAEIESLVAAARAEGHGAAAEVVDLCSIFGNPSMAAGFIAAKSTVADVRKALLAKRAESQDGTELNTAVMPGADAKSADTAHGKAAPWGDVLKSLGFKK